LSDDERRARELGLAGDVVRAQSVLREVMRPRLSIHFQDLSDIADWGIADREAAGYVVFVGDIPDEAAVFDDLVVEVTGGAHLDMADRSDVNAAVMFSLVQVPGGQPEYGRNPPLKSTSARNQASEGQNI